MSRLPLSFLIVLLACAYSCYGAAGVTNPTATSLSDTLTKLLDVLTPLVRGVGSTLGTISDECLQNILKNLNIILSRVLSIPNELIPGVLSLAGEVFGLIGGIGRVG